MDGGSRESRKGGGGMGAERQEKSTRQKSRDREQVSCLRTCLTRKVKQRVEPVDNFSRRDECVRPS